MIGSGNGHPFFLHRLKKGGLSFRWSPIDLVRQNDVGENRSFDEDEFPSLSILFVLQDFRTRYVGRHKIRGELNSTEGKRGGLRYRVDEESLG